MITNNPSVLTFQQWMTKCEVPENLQHILAQADIVLLPAQYRD